MTKNRRYSPNRKRSALSYVIEGLIPFTDANMKLTFAPGKFFRELAETSATDAERLQRAYYRAKASGIVRYIDLHFAIAPEYLEKLRREAPEKLPDGQSMLVIYDIPEELFRKRRELRSLLRELEFTQVQKSAWQTSYNHFTPVLAMIGKTQSQTVRTSFIGSTEFDSYMVL